MPRSEQPLGPGTDPLTTFARDLRKLRAAAGSPTYRELARRSHYSASTLSDAAGGKTLPSLAATLAYVAACEGDTSEWGRRWQQTAAELAATSPSGEPDVGNDEPAPYVGLVAFQPGDAEWFFGRDALIAELADRLGARRFLGVFGPSGCGKSSVLRAGLVARLNAEHTPANGPCPVVVFTPGRHPLEECAVRLATLLGQSPLELRDEFAADPRSLHLRIRQALVDHPRVPDLVVVVDQFEEIFTQCSDKDERSRFIDAIVTAATAATSRTRVVLGVRADFYGHCAHYPRLVDVLRDAQVLVGPMTADELRQAITRPAEHAGCRVETSLVARVVADASGQPGALPLVSHALLETWRRRRGTTITLTGYESAGGIHHALAHTAEAVYTALHTGQPGLARQIFLRLTALGDGTEDTKRRLRRRELDTGNPDTSTVLDQLTAARLITVDHDSVELAHEALIRHWPRLRDWLAVDREGLRIHRELTEATDAWESHGRDPEILYRGTRLARVETWATDRDTVLTCAEREFLHTSLSARTRDQVSAAHRVRRLRRLLALLAVLLVLTTAATVYAVRSQRTATQQRNAAFAQNALREATAIRATNPALAVQLALAAYSLDPTAAARSSMHDLFATPYATRLTGFAHGVQDVAISPDGKLLAVVSSDDKTMTRLLDISDPHRPRHLSTLPVHASAVTFSPNGRILAVTGDGATAWLWDVVDPSHPRDLGTARSGNLSGSLYVSPVRMVFRPDGLLLAAVGMDRLTRLWDVTDPATPRLSATLDTGARTRAGVYPNGSSVAFTSDGRALAATSPDQKAVLWDVTDPNRPISLTAVGVTGNVLHAVALSPNGRTMATASSDSPVQMWDVGDPLHPQPLAPLTGHTSNVIAMEFSRDGHLLATAGTDRSTRLWEVSDPHAPTLLGTITGHTDAVHAVAISTNGQILATVSADRTVRLEDISQLVLASHTESVTGVTFSPDGRTVATSSRDRTVRLWDLADKYRPQRLATLRHGDQEVASLSFSSDGRILATAGGTVARLWDVSEPRHPREATHFGTDGMPQALFSPHGPILAIPMNSELHLWDATNPHVPHLVTRLPIRSPGIRFSPSGTVLFIGSRDGSQLWDVTDPHHPRVVASLPTGLDAFKPDGRSFATQDRDARVTRLWTIDDSKRIDELAVMPAGDVADRNGGIYAPQVAISPDGRHLIAAGTARLWDITDPRHPHEEATLRTHTSDVLAVAFSPDGKTIATAGEDHVLRLWETNIDDIASHICEVAHPRLTLSEWDRYFPGLNYQPPCP